MKTTATVELVFDDRTLLTATSRSSTSAALTAWATSTASTRPVEKKFKDEPWVRWNLVSLGY